jgi:hypothetical protein
VVYEREFLEELIKGKRRELNATPWWRFFRRQEAGEAYRLSLLMGAIWELRNNEWLDLSE